MLHPPTKVTYTERGLQVRQELKQEISQAERFMSGLQTNSGISIGGTGVGGGAPKRRQNQNRNDGIMDLSQDLTKVRVNSNGGGTAGTLAGDTSAPVLEKCSTALDLVLDYGRLMTRKANTEQDVKEFLLPNLAQSNVSPYIRRKLDQATQDILHGGVHGTGALPPPFSPVASTESIHRQHRRRQQQDFSTLQTQTFKGSQNQSYTSLHVNNPVTQTLNTQTHHHHHQQQQQQHHHQQHSQQHLHQQQQQQQQQQQSQHNAQLLAPVQNNNRLQESTSNLFFRDHVSRNAANVASGDRQNKMLHYESKFQRMTDNWINLQHMREKEQELLKRSVYKSPRVQTLLTRPETLQEINAKHPDVAEIIAQPNHAAERAQEIFFQLHARTYMKRWTKTYFPMSTQQRRDHNVKVRYRPNLSPVRDTQALDDEGKRKVWRL